MREPSAYMNEREIYVLNNHPAMTYESLAAELGISKERVRQVKVAAVRKVKAEKRRDYAMARAAEEVSVTLQRGEIWLVRRCLDAMHTKLLSYRGGQHRNPEDNDPDIQRIELLRDKLNGI